MKDELRFVGVKFPLELFEKVEKLAGTRGESLSETVRNLVTDGLAFSVTKDNTDLIAKVVRGQVDIAMKLQVDRLASLIVKAGIMSSASFNLNAQAIHGLLPVEERKDLRTIHDKSRAMGYMYMRTNQYELSRELELLVEEFDLK